jgi:hypothetical protein
MTDASVEDGVRGWLRVLPPGAPLTMSLLVADLAPHLRADALTTVRAMERAGVAEITVRQRCPVCFGLDGVHDESAERDHGEPEEIATFTVAPDALPAWVVARLAALDIVIQLVGMPEVGQRWVEADARIEATARVEGMAQRDVRLRVGMGGNEGPLHMHPGRDYLRLRFGGAVDLGADRRVVDIDAMRLLGSDTERVEFRERLRRRLHGLYATPLVPPDAALDTLEQSRCTAAFEEMLTAGRRYRRQTGQDSWRRLAEDWGIGASSVQVRLDGSALTLLVCLCDADVRPHVHAFEANGNSVNASSVEPAIGAFCEHARQRVRWMQEREVLHRQLARGIELVKGALALVGAAAVTEGIGVIAPGAQNVPVHLIAVLAGVAVAGLVLGRPLRHWALLSWRLRSGTWDPPARRR